MVWHLLVHVVCQRIICIDIDATVFLTDIKVLGNEVIHDM